MRRPIPSLVAATVLLLAAAAPVLAIETGSAGVSTLPDRFESRRGLLLLNEEFPGETTDPVEIVVDGNVDSPAVRRGIERLEAALERNGAFGPPTAETDEAGRTTVLTVPVAGDPLSAQAVASVRE